MADQEIKYKVTADTTQAKQAFKELNGEVDGMKNSAEETIPSVDGLADSVKNAGTATETTTASTGMLGSLLTMGLVAGITVAGVALIGLAKDYFALDGEVKNLTSSLKDSWSETFKASEEWKKFSAEIKKFNTEQTVESIRALKEEIEDLGYLQDVFDLSWTGLQDIEGNIVKLTGKLKLLNKELESKNAQDWFEQTFGWRLEDKDKLKGDKATPYKPKGLEGQVQVLKMLEDQLTRTNKKYQDFFEFQRKVAETGGALWAGKDLGMKGVKIPKKPDPLSDADYDAMYENAMRRDELIRSSAFIMEAEFSQAWENIFGEANSLFEKLIANWVSMLAGRFANNFLNWLLPGSGFLADMFGVSNGSNNNGQPIQNNIIIDGQQTAIIYTSGRYNAKRLRM